MVNIILSSHGDTAKGVLDSAKMIVGDVAKSAVAVTFTRDNNAKDLNKKLKTAVNKFKNDDETLFLVDLLGGTPYNQAAEIVSENEGKMAIVAGLNLPMFIETLMNATTEKSATKLATKAVTPGRDGVSTFPVDLMPAQKKANTSTVSKKSSGSIGKKVPGGKGLDVRLARIDSRLLHGQVATAWSKEANPKRILVVSDSVAKDELRKTLISQAAPAGITATTIPIKKLVEIWDDKRFENLPTMLLFENPQDADAAVDAGVNLKEINVGSMAFSEGRNQKMIDSVNAVGPDELKSFEDLKKHGVKFNVRKVPSDRSSDLFELIKKAGVKA